MDVSEFRDELLQASKLGAAANMAFDRTEFINTVVKDLIEFEECTDFTPCFYEGRGARGKKIEIDGYNFDDDDNTLSIFICHYSGDEEMKTITKTDVNSLSDYAINFIKESFSGTIQLNADESTEAYDLATQILKDRALFERFRIYIISDCIKSDRIKTLELEDLDGRGVILSLWDISNIYEVQVSKKGYDEIEIDLSDYDNKYIPCIKTSESLSSKYDSFLCIMPGKLLSDLFEKYGGRLLEANVRSFLRLTTKANKNIRATILKEPDMFFAYNNGITATVTGLNMENVGEGVAITKMTSLQIVNGGQTTVTLYTVGKSKDNPDLNTISVPMKISVIPPEDAGEVVPKISRSANTQNKVSEADFFSNHPFHREMERYSRNTRVSTSGLAYTTRWYYERARGQYIQDQMSLTAADKNKFKLENPKNQYLTKTDLAKCWNSYKGNPDIVSKGAQYSFLTFAKEISLSWEFNKAKYNELYFKNSVALFILFKSTESIVSSLPWYKGGYRANIVTYTIAKISDMLSKINYTLDLKKIWDRQEISDPLRRQIAIVSERVYESITNDNKEDNIGQWCKKRACWIVIKSKDIELLHEMQKCIISEKKDNWQTRTETTKNKDRSLMNANIEVVNLGPDYWQDVYNWGIEHQSLSGFDKDLLKCGININCKLPSEKQSAQIIIIRNRLQDEGYPR